MIIFLSLSLDIFEYKSESVQQTLVQKKLTLFIIFAFSNAGHIIKGRAGLLECVSAVPAAQPVL